MGNVLYIFAAVAIGASLSLQPPINAAMARILGSPMLAATVSIAISLVLVVPVWLVFGKSGGDLGQIKALPWWVIIGGAIGVIFVAGSVVVAPVLGVTLFFICVIAGQLFASVIADQVGAFGLQAKPVNLMKVIGLCLVIAGAVLVQRSDA